MSVCLDAIALLAWLQDELGAGDVENYLSRAEKEEEFSCYLSTINLGEVFYRGRFGVNDLPSQVSTPLTLDSTRPFF